MKFITLILVILNFTILFGQSHNESKLRLANFKERSAELKLELLYMQDKAKSAKMHYDMASSTTEKAERAAEYQRIASDLKAEQQKYLSMLDEIRALEREVYFKNPEGKGFYGTVWGAHLQSVQIKNRNLAVALRNDSLICYTDIVFDKNVLSLYNFDKKKRLTTGKHIFRDNYGNKEKFIEQYVMVSDSLREKFGEPVLQEDDEVYIRRKIWQTNTSYIDLILGENDGFSFFIEWTQTKQK